MFNKIFSMTLLIAAIVSMAIPAMGAKENEEGFKQVFDGKSLEGWKVYKNSGEEVPLGESAWSVKDGEIYCDGQKSDYWIVVPGGKYGDMTIKFEFKVAKRSNSGLFLKCPANDLPAYKGYEVQILADHGDRPGLHTTGSIYDVLAPMRNMNKEHGEWNEMEVINKGTHVIVIVNGIQSHRRRLWRTEGADR